MQNSKIIDVKKIVVRFSGDSGDGIQLMGNLFSNISAITGNQIATFPDYPSEIRAPQGTLFGVSGYQVHIGADIHSSGESADVLVAMNPAALKTNTDKLTKDSLIIIDSDSLNEREYKRAEFKTKEPFGELNIDHIQRLEIPISSLTLDALKDMDMPNNIKSRSKNMLALGVICWLFDRNLDKVNEMLSDRFASRPKVVEANLKVLAAGYNYASNVGLAISTYKVETVEPEKGLYMDVTGNMGTAYGLVAASEKSKRPLFLASYPITPATEILQELTRMKSLGVKAMQAEDEIASVCAAIGASFAGHLAVTTTSGPGLALKGEAIGLAVMAELPLVVIDVQRSGPSTGMPTKTEQGDLMQALYGRNGESPIVVLASTSPSNCFDMAYWAAKIAMEHVTPVILLSDAYVANGSSAWKIPNETEYLDINPHDASKFDGEDWNIAQRNEVTKARYWAKVGDKGFAYRTGGLERDLYSGEISSDGENHQVMTEIRQEKISVIANYIPDLEVIGDKNADLLIVGWGGTGGHLKEAVFKMLNDGTKVALAQFAFISPLPKNTEAVLRKYKRVIVAEQNKGMFAKYLRGKIENLSIKQYNSSKGQPFNVSELIEFFNNELEEI